MLTYYLPKLKVRKVKSLLKGSGEEQADSEEEKAEADEIASHWHQVSVGGTFQVQVC